MRLLISFAVLILSFGACNKGSVPSQTCKTTADCPTGLICDTNQGVCVASTDTGLIWQDSNIGTTDMSAVDAAAVDSQTAVDQSVPVPDSGQCPATQPNLCNSSCVNTQKNENHCGQCNNKCGANATCEGGKCLCTSNKFNCNGNFASDGCECTGGCNGTACKTTCTPNCTNKCPGAPNGCGGTCSAACSGCCYADTCYTGDQTTTCGKGGGQCAGCQNLGPNWVCENYGCVDKSPTCNPACTGGGYCDGTVCKCSNGCTYDGDCTCTPTCSPACTGTNQVCSGGTCKCKSGWDSCNGTANCTCNTSTHYCTANLCKVIPTP